MCKTNHVGLPQSRCPPCQSGHGTPPQHSEVLGAYTQPLEKLGGEWVDGPCDYSVTPVPIGLLDLGLIWNLVSGERTWD